MLQKKKILQLLLASNGKEVSALDIVRKTWVLHYTEIIRLLRKEGFVIVNRTEYKKDVKHSFYSIDPLTITEVQGKKIKEYQIKPSFFSLVKHLFFKD